MIYDGLITENMLDSWIDRNSRQAQEIVPSLVDHLIAAAIPSPRFKRFPQGDSIGQHGPDGVLDTDIGFPGFVPDGLSYWETGSSKDAHRKASDDYNKLTASTPPEIRQQAGFIFVTPRSAYTDWEYTWKPDGQAEWLNEMRIRNEWKSVDIIDGTKIIAWLHKLPVVELWLARQMGILASGITTPELHWDLLQGIGSPPLLPPQVILANRDEVCKAIDLLLEDNCHQLKIETYHSHQLADLVSAHIASMNPDKRIRASGRCLIVTHPDSWNQLTNLSTPHVLVAEFLLEEQDRSGLLLLEQAKRKQHNVIFWGLPGGTSHPKFARLYNPTVFEVQKALEDGGYTEERSRSLALKCQGNLTTLLNILQRLSSTPEWSQKTEAAELAVIQMIGEWDDGRGEDKTTFENITGKTYGECIGIIQRIALLPDTPLTHHEGIWKFTSRYEVWYELGKYLFDEHISRFKGAAIQVLRERDPKFDLPPNERYMANIKGKVLQHSNHLRKGIAETLALLGNHKKALTSCTLGQPEKVARFAVSEILKDTDWKLWASLEDVSPLIAEAAPEEFLKALERDLINNPSIFIDLFTQEGDGFFGGNYMCGLLWALETLAWESEFFLRTFMVLGKLASIDPGGKSVNRPLNSMTTILLPWLPQTCASLQKRQVAVEKILNDYPGIGWSLLLSLLPKQHDVSSGTRRPTWRETIPQEWSNRVSSKDHYDQVRTYTKIVIREAEKDFQKLVELVERLDCLPQDAMGYVLLHLESESILSLKDDKKVFIWNLLNDLISKHKRFTGVEWTLPEDLIERITSVSKKLTPVSPFYRYQRIFSERDRNLLEERGNYDEQMKRIQIQRQDVILEMIHDGGVEKVLEFSKLVESPWRVGFSLGVVADEKTESAVLPRLLESIEKPLSQLAGGYILGRFKEQGLPWVDSLDMGNWSYSLIGQFLAFLPFEASIWERVSRLLKGNESHYWLKASVNPFGKKENLSWAVDRLTQFGRANEAIECLWAIKLDQQAIDWKQAVQALDVLYSSAENIRLMDTHAIVEVIKDLQDDAAMDQDELAKVEWRFLRCLERDRDAYPKCLEGRLAYDPNYFSWVIKNVFQSENEGDQRKILSEYDKMIAENGYHLLDNWQIIPGTQKDGEINHEALKEWLSVVKQLCGESGHLKSALRQVGKVMTHAPADPAGLWIHKSIAELLEAEDAEDLRDGYRSGRYFARSVYWGTGGKEERELALKFREEVEALENLGFVRFATSLKKVAKSYDQEAEREELEHRMDD